MTQTTDPFYGDGPDTHQGPTEAPAGPLGQGQTDPASEGRPSQATTAAGPTEPAWAARARAAAWGGPPAQPAEPAWAAQARAASWGGPPAQPAEPAWAAEARAAGWSPAGSTAAPNAAAAPGGTPTGTLVQGGMAPSGLVPVGIPPNAQPGVDEEGIYTALPGESLTLIAEKFGHPGEWRALHYANFDQVMDPATTAPGQRLQIPQEWLNTEQPADEQSSTDRPA